MLDAERRKRRMAAAAKVMEQMNATARFEPPPADEADAWSWGVFDKEDPPGHVVERGSIWLRKDLAAEWQRLRFSEEGEP